MNDRTDYLLLFFEFALWGSCGVFLFLCLLLFVLCWLDDYDPSSGFFRGFW